MKIYTKKGDQGETRLGSGERVTKDHPLLKMCGDLDELNTALGLIISALPDSLPKITTDLQIIQKCLIKIGAQLASVPYPTDPMPENLETGQYTRNLEEKIDRMQAELPPCHEFILPGGHESACRAHLARTICRRAERRIVGWIAGRDNRNPYSGILPFINRLSDYLFVLARYCNMKTDVSEKK